MKKIAVLLSSYNGYEYIEEQIESIYGQSYKEIELYVRDDGSEKAFVEQLRTLQDKYGFTLIEGDNVGFVQSFMEMLKIVENADYYAFADQDDIWMSDKLKCAIDWLNKEERDSIPLLFHGAYDIIESDSRKKIKRFYYSEEGYDFRRSITENHYSGFSMVINRTLRKLMLQGNPHKIGYHDWWAAMITKALGKACFDEHVAAHHRAHGDNVTTFNIKTRFQWLIRSVIDESDIHKRCVEFDRCFGNILSEKKKSVLDMFSNDRYDFYVAMKKCFYPKRWRPIWSSELVLRLLMLVGKV